MRSEFVKNLWRWKCGLPEVTENEVVPLAELQNTEWSSEFETLMRNRLIFGSFRYGRINGANKPKYDYLGDIIKRANRFIETGNKELLVDIANLCLVEFVQNNHPNAHFESVDDGIHTQQIK